MPKNDFLARKTPRVGKKVKKFLTSSHDARPKEKFIFENCDLKSQYFEKSHNFLKKSHKVTIHFKSQKSRLKSQKSQLKSQKSRLKSQKSRLKSQKSRLKSQKSQFSKKSHNFRKFFEKFFLGSKKSRSLKTYFRADLTPLGGYRAFFMFFDP